MFHSTETVIMASNIKFLRRAIDTLFPCKQQRSL